MKNNLGLYNIVVDGKNVLRYNGRIIDSVFNDIENSYGLYVNGKELDIDGLWVACSATQGHIDIHDDGLYLNEVDLFDKLECINITLSDYNNLLKGKAVDGYKRYNQYSIYNIVSDVTNADTITYTISDNKIIFSNGKETDKVNNIIYNSVSDKLTENTLDTEKTMLDVNCPFVNVRYFDPKIGMNDTIDIVYYVDDRFMTSQKRNNISDTFTVIIETEDGDVTKRTTYAGEFHLETPQFKRYGETWFSIQCIDSNGVGSAVQFFDVWVRDEMTEHFYTMKESDLTKYGIVPDSTDSIASYNNKAAFSNFFAAVKSGEIDGSNGYNGVVLLNRTYWINYHKNLSSNGYDFGSQRYFEVNIVTDTITSVTEVNEAYVKAKYPTYYDISYDNYTRTYYIGKIPTVGTKFAKPRNKNGVEAPDGIFYLVYNTAHEAGDYIVFPDNFTIDMNDASFRAVPSTDVFSGFIVYMKFCFNTHLRNGKLIGNYENYDFYNSLIQTGVSIAAEHLCVIGTNGCRYCSLDNIDISYSMGYAGPFGGSNNIDGRTPNIDEDINSQRVDIDSGGIVNADDMIVITKRTMSYPNPPQKINIQGVKELCFGRWGYGGYGMGQQRELFYSFYDENEDYICTIKSKLYFACKVPSNAVYLRVTGYGSNTDWPSSTTNGGLSIFLNSALTTDLEINNCCWHDTRTCAINPTLAKGLKFKDCYFYNVATYNGGYNGEQAVTTVLGDFEDGWQWTSKVLMDGCICNKGIGTTQLIIHYCNGLNFANCKNINIYNKGGIESGFIEHNEFNGTTININYMSYNPYVIYDDNKINSLGIIYNGDTTGQKNVGTIDPNVSMSNTTINDTCLYDYLRLRNTVNGTIKVQ